MACLALWANTAKAERWRPTADVGTTIDGVWRSRGYGWIVVLRDGHRTLYHRAGRFCYADPSGGGEDDAWRLVTVIDSRRIAFAASPDQTRYAFDRIDGLPSRCTAPRRWTAALTADVIAATFDDLYAGFGQRGRTRTRLAAALAKAKDIPTDLAVFQRITAALDGLDDAHVGLAATIDGVDRIFESGEAPTIRAARSDVALGSDPAERAHAWSLSYRHAVTSLLDGGGQQVANRRILWGRIGRIGYLNIVAMGAFDKDTAADDPAALDSALDTVIGAFRGLPGVIVDVTNNRGGYDAISLRIAGRFADRRQLAFVKRAVGVAGPYQRFYVTPSRRARHLGKVALLTSDVTVSAGETFTLAMRSLPNVIHIGARTRGALSDQLTKPLPNGWTLTLPAETYRDAAGRSQEGIGIAPTRAVPPFTPDHATMIAQVARQLDASR